MRDGESVKKRKEREREMRRREERRREERDGERKGEERREIRIDEGETENDYIYFSQ